MQCSTTLTPEGSLPLFLSPHTMPETPDHLPDAIDSADVGVSVTSSDNHWCVTENFMKEHQVKKSYS